MKFRILIFVFFILGAASQLVAQSYAKVNINNVATFVWNDGRMDISPDGNAGFEYWKGTKRFSVFTSGVYWGGYIDNELRVGGTYYNTSLRPGNEQNEGHIYKIRPDYYTATLSGEINDEGKTLGELRNDYEVDYRKWPIRLGAPYDDLDNNGFYNEKDKPGFHNADQTLWFVCNDFGSSLPNQMLNTFNSKPTNIEVQITIWAYSKNDLLKGTIFKSCKLINKDKFKTIKDMYLGIFSDPDIGDLGDDYSGCDTLLSLGYVYNAKDNDNTFGKNLTIAGTLLLESPVVNGTGSDSIIKNGKEIKGKKYLGMTTFVGSYPTEDYIYGEPIINPGYYYNKLIRAYPWYNPITKGNTNFPFSGDPVKKTGFVDGILQLSGDRRIQLNSGPFNMAPGDTQEVIFAQIVTSSTSRLGSVSYLKYLAKYVKDFYENEMFAKSTANQIGTELPTHFALEQNYPNPFNPKTSIVYELPVAQNVTISVFNSLGEKISTLVNEFKEPGRYTVEFDGSNLSSGVYFYYLEAGEYIKTKKMVLLK
ncbi:MAG: T9SS type A sorting domain-containing protein [Melioribacteraceae bacterium]